MNLLLTLLLVGAAAAGDHRFGVETGATFLSRTDWMLSPTNLSGVLPQLGLDYEGRGDRWVLAVSLSATSGSYRDQPVYAYTRDGEAQSTEPSLATIAHLDLAVGRRIEAGAWDLRLGGISANQAGNYVFVAGFLGVEHYDGAFELAPWLHARRDLGARHHLELEAWVPVAAWLCRNPYPLHNSEHIWNTRSNFAPAILLQYIADGAPATLNRYQASHARIGWTTDLSDRFSLAGRARLDWLHDAEPHPLVELQLGADVALQGRF